MTVIPIYGEKKTTLCPVTVLVDSQVSDRCPWATCFRFLFLYYKNKLYALRAETGGCKEKCNVHNIIYKIHITKLAFAYISLISQDLAIRGGR